MRLLFRAGWSSSQGPGYQPGQPLQPERARRWAWEPGPSESLWEMQLGYCWTLLSREARFCPLWLGKGQKEHRLLPRAWNSAPCLSLAQRTVMGERGACLSEPVFRGLRLTFFHVAAVMGWSRGSGKFMTPTESPALGRVQRWPCTLTLVRGPGSSRLRVRAAAAPLMEKASTLQTSASGKMSSTDRELTACRWERVPKAGLSLVFPAPGTRLCFGTWCQLHKHSSKLGRKLNPTHATI